MLMTILGALTVVLFASLSSGAEYFVAPTGSDSNNGTFAKPFREIRKALTVVAPGDTVSIADGSYKGFDAVSLGSASTTTTVRGLGSNVIVTPTTDRGTNNPNNIVVWLCTNVVFDGLRSFQATKSGMRIVESNGVTVRNCTFGDHQYWGIVTSFSNDLLLENNECYGSKIEHGIYVANSGDCPIVRGNRLHDNAGSGLRSNGDVSQGGDGIITGAVFENNIIYNNCVNGGAGINCDGLQDGIIRNNLIYNNAASGITLFKGGGAQGPKGMQLLHNTIVLPSTGRYNLRITDVAGTLTVRNNILYNFNNAKGPFSWNTASDAAYTDSDYNVFGGGRYVSTDGEVTKFLVDAWMTQGHEVNSIPSATITSLVIDAAADNYQLSATSPALNRGALVANAPKDLLGINRPYGSAPDLGAYESAPFEAWKTACGFSSTTSNTDDSDRDGVGLLMEYALGLDPNHADATGLPTASTTGDELRLSYTKVRTDVGCVVEASSNLRDWTTDGVNQGGAGPSVTASVSLANGPRFLRLRVTL